MYLRLLFLRFQAVTNFFLLSMHMILIGFGILQLVRRLRPEVAA